MAEKDITEKILMDYNDIFSDIINVLLFKGKRRVEPDSLEAVALPSQYKAEDGKIHEQERDVTKYWKGNGIRIALFGLENQTESEKDMVFRAIGYDGANYRSQLFSDSTERVPVITLVLFFGSGHWTAPKRLKELISIPEGLDEYISDYKINVFEISWLTDEQVAMFQSDFGVVADFFVNKRKNPQYEPSDTRTIKHVDEVLKLLSVMTGDNRYENILKDTGKEEIHTMCDVAERLEKKGYDSGLKDGAEKERESIYQELVKDGVLTAEEAAKRSGIPPEKLL